MEPLRDLNRAMEYIEEQLTGTIDFSQIERIAGCSEYHFRRMFSYISGINLSEYIRNRKLTVALDLLRDDSHRIIDIAIELGYESPDSFARAFQVMHGETPSMARKHLSDFSRFDPMTFRLTITGGIKMLVRIEEKEEFKIVGVHKRIALVHRGVNPQMNSMLSDLTMERILELKGMSNTTPKGIISVSTNFSKDRAEGSLFEHYIGVATTLDVQEESWKILAVPKYTWAVFTVVGKFPDALQETWAKIYTEWFPSSEYQSVKGPEMLWHESPDTSKHDYHSEIWIPVTRIQ